MCKRQALVQLDLRCVNLARLCGYRAEGRSVLVKLLDL